MVGKDGFLRFSVPVELDQKLEALCKRTGMKKSKLLRKLIEENLDFRSSDYYDAVIRQRRRVENGTKWVKIHQKWQPEFTAKISAAAAKSRNFTADWISEMLEKKLEEENHVEPSNRQSV